jgi:GR25 family glycosyltransferase involved in LPS biosynthesis
VLNSFLLDTARDLSNNASVNIYMNHARMWAMVLTRKWDYALLLEDDIIVPKTVDETVAQLLASLQQNNVSNFVVKLVDHWVAWQWTSVLAVGSHDLRTCTCRPAIHSSSSAAYIIDKHAAQTLLDNAFPASMHVDSYTHDMGCNKGMIRLFQIYPHLAHYTNRPSTHMRNTSPQRAFLLVKEIISNTLSSNC